MHGVMRMNVSGAGVGECDLDFGVRILTMKPEIGPNQHAVRVKYPERDRPPLHYRGQRCYALRFLTHAAYDDARWKQEL